VCIATTFTICVTEGTVNIIILENLCPSAIIFGGGAFGKCVYVLVAANQVLINFSHASVLGLCCGSS
jgi:hypothetical protein